MISNLCVRKAIWPSINKIGASPNINRLTGVAHVYTVVHVHMSSTTFGALFTPIEVSYMFNLSISEKNYSMEHVEYL